MAVLVVASLVLASCLIKPGDPGPSDVQFTINSAAQRHPISPLIYGSNTSADKIAPNGLGLAAGGNQQVFDAAPGSGEGEFFNQ